MLRSLFKVVVRLIGFLVPVRVVSTFFGIGHLPAWQEHWAALSALLISHISCYMVYGSFPLLSDAAFATGLKLAPFFLQMAALLFFVGMMSIFVYQNSDASSGLVSSDNIVIQSAFGQLFTAAATMPASVTLYGAAGGVYNKICSDIFTCPLWVNYFMHLLIFFMVPFIFYNAMIVIRPWPASLLKLRYSNWFSIMMEGVVLSFYAMLVMYLVAFICAGLQVSYALKYGAAVLRLAFVRWWMVP
ncbi:phosphatidylglycerophosphatase [Anaplasma capra]|uniref:phosphatidylglycerophosphatase n=1 Tax=Anaplasma capra TaxID=1562740 RepID=UPI0021D5B8E6|nr:phosphatidylglycerophosphatase [Anaplasma capra]MCU7611389.1 phosphatidylglycerophosphatase [Anaplasma capra]MCU7612464.1 phosphatidylglycerophosphatase [Anaplasma capra]